MNREIIRSRLEEFINCIYPDMARTYQEYSGMPIEPHPIRVRLFGDIEHDMQKRIIEMHPSPFWDEMMKYVEQRNRRASNTFATYMSMIMASEVQEKKITDVKEVRSVYGRIKKDEDVEKILMYAEKHPLYGEFLDLLKAPMRIKKTRKSGIFGVLPKKFPNHIYMREQKFDCKIEVLEWGVVHESVHLLNYELNKEYFAEGEKSCEEGRRTLILNEGSASSFPNTLFRKHIKVNQLVIARPVKPSPPEQKEIHLYYTLTGLVFFNEIINRFGQREAFMILQNPRQVSLREIRYPSTYVPIDKKIEAQNKR